MKTILIPLKRLKASCIEEELRRHLAGDVFQWRIAKEAAVRLA